MREADQKGEMSVDPQDVVAMQGCVCGALRRADRAISQFYDAVLSPSGVSCAQFNLLAALTTTGPMTISQFADQLIMDRTTLTRNLKLLTTHGWVDIIAGKDRRTRLIAVTTAGDGALKRALPLWKQAQAHMVDGLGRQQLATLRAELDVVVALSQ
jgi:DNA-binding MarR family transcriptional regulator